MQISRISQELTAQLRPTSHGNMVVFHAENDINESDNFGNFPNSYLIGKFLQNNGIYRQGSKLI